jgi:8-oxo-dGTP diphosphatase
VTRLLSTPPRSDRPTQSVLSCGGTVFDEDGKVLLLRRADEDLWCFPKGHVEAGETPRIAARREIREETGLDVAVGEEVLAIRYAYYWPREDVNYDKVVRYFLCTVVGGRLRLEPTFDAHRWADRPETLRLLYHANDKEVARRAFALRPTGATRASDRRPTR